MAIPQAVERGLAATDRLAELVEYERLLKSRLAWSDEIEAAFNIRAAVVGCRFVAAEAGASISELTPAEEKIASVVAEYILIKERAGTNANRTIQQIKSRGLIGAAEASIARAQPTQGYTTLVDEGQESLSYEQIVLDHPEEFTERALWFARRTRGLPNAGSHAPADGAARVQLRTLALLQWLRERARVGDGLIAPYENAEAAIAIGLGDMAKFGRVHGNIQSRLDFACWRVRLPPLGLTARMCFAKAWGNEGRSWSYPVAQMQRAAQFRRWTEDDFNRIEAATEGLSGQAHIIWRQDAETLESEQQRWAFGLKVEDDPVRPVESLPTLPEWPSDALLLIINVRLQAGGVALSDTEVDALANDLLRLGAILPDERLSKVDSDAVRSYLMILDRHEANQSLAATSDASGNRPSEQLRAVAAIGPHQVRELADAIRAALDGVPAALGAAYEESADIERPEGRILIRQHRYRERSPELARLRKQRALAEHGRLVCEACGCDFQDRYGADASRVIECHHRQPLHTRTEVAGTKLEDLSLLCANCHRIIHALSELLTVEQLRERIAGGDMAAVSV